MVLVIIMITYITTVKCLVDVFNECAVVLEYGTPKEIYQINPFVYLQIWLRPNKHNFPPHYDVMQFTKEDKLDKFCPIASNTGPIHINSDAKVFAGIFTKNHTVHLDAMRIYYMYIISGTATLYGTNGSALGVFIIENESIIEIR